MLRILNWNLKTDSNKLSCPLSSGLKYSTSRHKSKHPLRVYVVEVSPCTGGSRFNRKRLNRNWPLSEIFSISHSCLSYVNLLSFNSKFTEFKGILLGMSISNKAGPTCITIDCVQSKALCFQLQWNLVHRKWSKYSHSAGSAHLEFNWNVAMKMFIEIAQWGANQTPKPCPKIKCSTLGTLALFGEWISQKRRTSCDYHWHFCLILSVVLQKRTTGFLLVLSSCPWKMFSVDGKWSREGRRRR